ncbi:hypothetical protein GCM10017044_11910 [Kordiimonas sediminis]|uniref:Uncharacterized protein n=1 Tax=Kordiimonas sediminis TaxID=1735581 RepID=A0A919APV7_9PROT|nr:hypothetical protein [Kordiimonas sediminis]GHF18973.1 hypothetical protein GCM10017044_11910 [Kordiimonas sediminis]
MKGLFGYLRQDQGMVDVYLYEDSKPITGFIAETTPELMFLKRVTDGPSFDGGSLVATDRVARVHKGGRSLESRRRLISEVQEPDWPGLDLRSWQSLSSVLKMSGEVVRVTLRDGDHLARFVGKILHFEEDIMELDAVGAYDDPDREQIFLKISDILQMDFGRKKDEDLYRYNLRALGPG